MTARRARRPRFPRAGLAVAAVVTPLPLIGFDAVSGAAVSLLPAAAIYASRAPAWQIVQRRGPRRLRVGRAAALILGLVATMLFATTTEVSGAVWFAVLGACLIQYASQGPLAWREVVDLVHSGRRAAVMVGTADGAGTAHHHLGPLRRSVHALGARIGVDSLAEVLAAMSAATERRGDEIATLRELAPSDLATALEQHVPRTRIERMRHWRNEKNLSRALGPLLPWWAANVGGALDTVRRWHTRQIEWMALYISLTLRAGLAVIALIHADSNVVVRALLLGYVFAVLAAGPWIVPAAEGHDARLLVGLSAADIIASGLMLEVAPGVAAIGAAGVTLNWLQRPEWRSRGLAVYVAPVAAYGIVILASDVGGWTLVGRLAASAALFAAVAGSYGQMLPLVAYLTVKVSQLNRTMRRARDAEWERRIGPVRDALRRVDPASDDPSVHDELRKIVRQIDRPPRPMRRRVFTLTRSLGELLDDVESTPLEADLEVLPCDPRPPSMTAWLLVPTDGLALERVLIALVNEAAAHSGGRYVLHIVVEPEAGEVVVHAVNTLTATPVGGGGSGRAEIMRLAAVLPECRLIAPGHILGNGAEFGFPEPVFKFSFAFSIDAFVRRESASG